MASHYRGGHNELIFVNNPDLQRETRVVVEEIQEGEQVDLEIIILGPKRGGKRSAGAKKRNKLRRFRGNNGKSSAKETESDSGSDEEASRDNEPGAENLANKTDQARQVNGGHKSPSPSVSSPKVDEGLLKRLESRYGQKRMVADDDTYVDYMDYF